MPACLLTADLQDKEQPTFSAVIDFWPPFGELLVMCLMLTCFAKRKSFLSLSCLRGADTDARRLGSCSGN